MTPDEERAAYLEVLEIEAERQRRLAVVLSRLLGDPDVRKLELILGIEKEKAKSPGIAAALAKKVVRAAATHAAATLLAEALAPCLGTAAAAILSEITDLFT